MVSATCSDRFFTYSKGGNCILSFSTADTSLVVIYCILYYREHGFVMYTCIASGTTIGRRTYDQEVAGSIRGLALLHNDCGQVVHTHVPLSQSRIIWY